MLLETRSLKQNGAYLHSTNTLTVLSTRNTYTNPVMALLVLQVDPSESLLA